MVPGPARRILFLPLEEADFLAGQFALRGIGYVNGAVKAGFEFDAVLGFVVPERTGFDRDVGFLDDDGAGGGAFRYQGAVFVVGELEIIGIQWTHFHGAGPGDAEIAQVGGGSGAGGGGRFWRFSRGRWRGGSVSLPGFRSGRRFFRRLAMKSTKRRSLVSVLVPCLAVRVAVTLLPKESL